MDKNIGGKDWIDWAIDKIIEAEKNMTHQNIIGSIRFTRCIIKQVRKEQHITYSKHKNKNKNKH